MLIEIVRVFERSWAQVRQLFCLDFPQGTPEQLVPGVTRPQELNHPATEGTAAYHSHLLWSLSWVTTFPFSPLLLPSVILTLSQATPKPRRCVQVTHPFSSRITELLIQCWLISSLSTFSLNTKACRPRLCQLWCLCDSQVFCYNAGSDWVDVGWGCLACLTSCRSIRGPHFERLQTGWQLLPSSLSWNLLARVTQNSVSSVIDGISSGSSFSGSW